MRQATMRSTRRGLRLTLLTTVVAATFALPVLAQTAPSAVPVNRVERGNLITENVPEPDKALADKYRAYLNARSAALLDWLPDGDGLLISTRFADAAQLHVVRQPMGARTQVTFREEPVTSAAVNPRPGGTTLLYRIDVGGNEQFQHVLLDLSTGQSNVVTDGKSRNEDVLWSHRGDRFAFNSTRRDSKNSDIYVGTLESAATIAPLLADTGSFSPVAWSADDSRLLVSQYISVTKSRLTVVDVASGQRTRVAPDRDNAALAGVGFTPDGTGIFITSDESGDYRRLGLHDLSSGKTRWLSPEVKWDVEGAVLSPDGRLLAYELNEGGFSTLHLIDTATLQPVKAPTIPAGVIGSLRFSPDSRKLALSISRVTAPSDVFVADLASGTVAQWTKSEVGGLNTDRFADATLISYPTFDKAGGKARQIPALIMKPRAPAGRLPVVIDIHGGPEGQSRPGFSATLQFWVNELGVAVIRPNVRGSTGYGKTYVSLDNGFKREDSVKDIGALLDWIATQPDLDPARIVVSGGSYGGYMTLAAMTHFNDRLAGGAATVGISNFVTFLESTAEYRRDLRRPEYGDERDPKMRAHLQKISPLTNAGKISKPMLIIQGANDPRVPLGEAEQMVAQIRRNGGDVWYVLAKDEGHGFKKRGNQFAGEMAKAAFFRKVFGMKG
jgi:dipeptidyl aminopeptidase/acylaminoacyl peptidase